MTRTLAACLAVAFITAAAPAADPKHDEVIEQLVQRRIGLTAKAAEVIAAVKDERTATDAKAKLDEIGEKYAAYKSAVEHLLAVERGRVSEQTLAAMAKADKDLLLAHDRVFSKEKAAYEVLHNTVLFARVELSLEAAALEGTRMLNGAAKNHAAKNGGEYAKELKTLTESPKKGVLPLIAGGEKALMDPWGFPYHYEIGRDKFDAPDTYIWTVSPYSGKKLGYPPPEKK